MEAFLPLFLEREKEESEKERERASEKQGVKSKRLFLFLEFLDGLLCGGSSSPGM
jgi:hypothetical protein